MKKYAYVRVSSKDQNEARQLAAIEKYEIPRKQVFIDKQSGKDFERTSYQRLLRKLKPEDLLVIKSIDRLGRNYDEIIEQWRYLTREKRVDIIVDDMPLLNTTYAKDILGTFIADLVLQILSYCAHIERENIHQRQAEGIEEAKKRGVKFGRPKKDFPPEFDEWYAQWRNHEISGDELADKCNMALGCVYRKLREMGVSLQEAGRYPAR